MAAKHSHMPPSQRKKPRIGLSGGMANNAYVAAKGLASVGADVVFVRDRTDSYSMSQPVWEDCRLTFDHDENVATSTWQQTDWDRAEQAAGWKAPDWLVDPRNTDLNEVSRSIVVPTNQWTGGLLGQFLPSQLRSMDSLLARIIETRPQHLPPNWQTYVYHFQQCDFLFVSSVNAIICALISKTPFYICPAGGEYMIASGLLTGTGNANAALETHRQLLNIAFQQCLATASSTPFYCNAPLVGGEEILDRDFKQFPYVNIGLPFEPEEPGPVHKKREVLNKTLAELGFDGVETKYAILVPSRIDYKNKGQDIILDAVSRCTNPEDFTFIFSAWGADFIDFRAKVEKAGSDGAQVVFLKHTVSKPILRDLLRGADLTIDQFLLGHYGTVTRESLAVGTPCVCWMNPDQLAKSPDLQLAPILSAHTATELCQLLDTMIESRDILDTKSKEGLDWVRNISSPQAFHDQLMQHYFAQ